MACPLLKLRAALLFQTAFFVFVFTTRSSSSGDARGESKSLSPSPEHRPHPQLAIVTVGRDTHHVGAAEGSRAKRPTTEVFRSRDKKTNKMLRRKRGREEGRKEGMAKGKPSESRWRRVEPLSTAPTGCFRVGLHPEKMAGIGGCLVFLVPRRISFARGKRCRFGTCGDRRLFAILSRGQRNAAKKDGIRTSR